MSSIAGSQARTFLQLYEDLHPYFRTDRNLPARIQQRLASERRFGSRDRRLYRELLYTAVRFLPWIEERGRVLPAQMVQAVVWLASSIPAIAPLKESLGDAWGPTPPTIAEKAKRLETTAPLVPSWTAIQCPAAAESPNIDVLHTRAPMWLRLQTADPAVVTRELEARGWTWQKSERFPDAIQVLGDVDVTSSEAFRRGWIEVQDIASQLLLPSVAPLPGTRWLDACAGAGGKSLQLARLLGYNGRVVAHDLRRTALDELAERAQRARASNITISFTVDGTFDGVLVDAPCTGTGTWRRSPHLKWCTTPDGISEAARQQQTLLTTYAANVAPGGLLVYATCSLCREENQAVVDTFLAAHSEFSPAPLLNRYGGIAGVGSLTFLPAEHNSDGFFVAAMRRS